MDFVGVCVQILQRLGSIVGPTDPLHNDEVCLL